MAVDFASLLSVIMKTQAWPFDARLLLPEEPGAPRKSIEERKAETIAGLIKSGIDPELFDVLISNEMNRRLKTQFGIAFLAFTFVFTAASYSIIVADGFYKLGISPTAITGLVIETPLQFIGLLYIIARNLFPVVTPTLAPKSHATPKPSKTSNKRIPTAVSQPDEPQPSGSPVEAHEDGVAHLGKPR